MLQRKTAWAHATCDAGADLKNRIRTGFEQACTPAMEECTKHDRQIYWHAQELCISCNDYLNCGQQFVALARSVCQCCLIARWDGSGKVAGPAGVLQKRIAFDKL